MRDLRDLDEKVLRVPGAVHDPRGLQQAHHFGPRHRRGYAEAVRDMSEWCVSDGTVPYPGTVPWCAQWVGRRPSTSVSHLRWFTSTFSSKTD
eukprot:3867912-Pyramimonas_sp.AAC.1